MKKILILCVNPSSTTRLRVDEEMREIKEGLRRSKHRNSYEIITAEAVRYRDVQRTILENEPNIVHFSGHGDGEQGLVFEDIVGGSKLVDAEALAGLFALFSDTVQCVVLNACYSEVQGSAIAQHIPYVVGMNKAIGDRAAIEFAIGFYDGLGAGRDYVFAYKLGCSAVKMAGIKENLTPQLLTNPDLVASLDLSQKETDSSENNQRQEKYLKENILKVIDERIKSINPEKEIADRVNLPVEMVRHYLDELTKQEYIEGAKSYPTDGTGDLAYTYLWLTNKGKFTLRNFDSLISKQASSRPEAKEKTESPTKDNLQEATIYGFAPESIGSNIVSGQTVQGNTFIGTQNNYGVMSPQSARDNSEDHVLQSLLEINRQSKKGINYIRLANLLAEKRWRQADQETKRIIDKLADQEGKSDLNEEDIKNIPIEDLGILDQLWSKFSNDHFGFRVQLQIWLEEGGKIDPEILKRFSERVGIVKNNRRLNYGDLDFNLKAPQGQFPLIWSVSSLEIVSGDLVSKNRLILLEHYNELLTSRFNKQTIKLRSERGVDYTKLEELLKEKKWIEADQETKKLMYKAIKQFDPWEKAMKTGQSIELVTPKEIDNFPCEDLQIIDELWVKYSNGRFGFSVQSQIYIDDLGGTKEYNQTLFLQFSDCVGWSRRGAFVNSTFQSKNVPKDAPRGHLPHLRQAKEFYVVSVPGQNEDWILKLLHRVKTCNL